MTFVALFIICECFFLYIKNQLNNKYVFEWRSCLHCKKILGVVNIVIISAADTKLKKKLWQIRTKKIKCIYHNYGELKIKKLVLNSVFNSRQLCILQYKIYKGVGNWIKLILFSHLNRTTRYIIE